MPGIEVGRQGILSKPAYLQYFVDMRGWIDPLNVQKWTTQKQFVCCRYSR